MQPFTNRPQATGEAPLRAPGAPTDNGGPRTSARPSTDRHVPRAATADSVVEVGHLSPVLVRRTYELVTERAFHVVDVTDDCKGLVADSGVQEGVLSVFSPHTTCAVKINERETCFLEDLRLFMETLVPPDAYYRHDDHEIRDPETLAGAPEDEPINGHAHIKQMLLGAASESVPVIGGRLGLGRWQRIMFIELDQSRPRCIELQVQGWR